LAHFFVAGFSGIRAAWTALPPAVLIHRTVSTAHSVPRLRLELHPKLTFYYLTFI
jgi:hypothetical protein